MSIEKGPGQRERSKIKADLKNKVGTIFDELDKGDDRIDKLISNIRGLLDSDLFDGKAIEEDLKRCGSIEDRGEFIVSVEQALEPIIDMRVNNPEVFEKEVSRRAFVEGGNFIPLNEIVSYDMNREGWAYLHLAPARTMGPREALGKIDDALKQLAIITKENESFQGIRAASWIVANNPRLLEKFGFIIDGPIEGDEKNRHFPGETRPVSLAHISRKDLIDKYGKE
ncbi:hypothetical protein KJ839_03295 [Patescibacteria group bacterium]|nr:hypothetical protein [Patescibacteria group bacterium]